MNAVVFEYSIPGLLVVTVTGNNDGRFARYKGRLSDGFVPQPDCAAPKAEVVFKANRRGDWRLKYGGEEGLQDVEKKSEAGFESAPVFYETKYQLHCRFLDGSGASAPRVLHTMASVVDEFDVEDGGRRINGQLNFINSPGIFTFELLFNRNGGEERLKLEWWVVSEKMDVAVDYKAIVKAIESKTPGYLYAFLAKTKNGAGLAKTKNTLGETAWYDVFASFVQEYVKACNFVTNAPHLKYTAREQYLRADRIKRWTPQLTARFQSMDPGRQAIHAFRTERVEPDTDSVENRFVLSTVKDFAVRLRALKKTCEEYKAVAKSFTENLEHWGRQLDQIARHPFFARVGVFTGFRQESMVLQRKQGYAEIYNTWLKLRYSVDLMGKGLNVGYRPVWKLYEFWCYTKFIDLLDELVKAGKLTFVSGDLASAVCMDDLFKDPDDAGYDDEAEKTSKRIEYVYRDEAGNRGIKIVYQQNYSERKEDGVNLAFEVDQIPDIVLTIEDRNPGGQTYTYLFDAKYRIRPFPSSQKHDSDAAPQETINDMHRYRDAILYRRQDGQQLSREVIGAYILFPGRKGKAREDDYDQMIEKENVGAIALLPTRRDEATGAVIGKDGEDALRQFLGKILARKSKADHLGRQTPQRGLFYTEDELKVIKDENTLVVELPESTLLLAALGAKKYPVAQNVIVQQGKQREKIRRLALKVADRYAFLLGHFADGGMQADNLTKQGGEFSGQHLEGFCYLFEIDAYAP